MRRIAQGFTWMIALLLALASPAAAQNSNNCGQAATSRTFPAPGKVRYSTGMTCDLKVDTLPVTDSIAIGQLTAQLIATRDTLTTTRAALQQAQDSLAKWPKDSTVTPPPPPPADSGKDSTVTPPPAGGRALFAQEWTSLPAENGPAVAGWTRWGGQGVLALVAPTGLGFPVGLAKVLRVQMGTSAFDWVEVNGKWSLPAVGESRAFRLYWRSDVTATGNTWSSTHPFESKGTDGSISGNYYAWHFDQDGRWIFATEVAYPRNYLSVATSGNAIGMLPKGTTYRIEWKWTRTGANLYSLDLRVYNPDGSLRADNAGIWAWGGNTLASNNRNFPVDDWAMTGARIGTNGGFSASGTQSVYYGGFAVCTDWCGAYTTQ